MASRYKSPAEVKWAVRQRFQYIEIMAFYTGLVSRSDVARTFGLSDAAATKDLKAYSEQAPDNLAYRHSVFGFVPTASFQPLFADLSPEVVLPMIATNLATSGGAADRGGEESIYGIPVEALPLPTRLPAAGVCAPIIRAIKQHRQVRIGYKSLSDREAEDSRVIEPHSLVNTGLRWHVRAYNLDTYDFRDFVLSRIVAAELLNSEAESNLMYDDDWVELATLQLAPHPKLDARKRESLLVDYNAQGDVIELEVRHALVGYMLHRLSVDTTVDHSMNPNAYQLVLVNRDEIEPFAGWAFL